MHNAGRATKQPYFQNIANEIMFADMLTKPCSKYVRVMKTARVERGKELSKDEIMQQFRAKFSNTLAIPRNTVKSKGI